MDKDEDHEWKFFEDLAEMTMMWESTREPKKSIESSSFRGLHSIGNSVVTYAKSATLTRRLEALQTSKPPIQMSTYPNYNFQNPATQPLHEFVQLEAQLSQLASTLCEREKNKFPSQPEVNQKFPLNQRPHENVNAIISLRSGNQVDNKVGEHVNENEESIPKPNPSLSSHVHDKPECSKVHESMSEPSPRPISQQPNEEVYKPKVPYPQRLIHPKQSAQMEQILEVFKQVKINIHLLDVIHQVPSYAKCLKDLCTHKRTTQVPKKAFLTSQVRSLLSNHIPVKYKDPGCPKIYCVIGDKFVDKALLDLGASVNLLPFSVYQALGLGDLKTTKMTLQLADHSVKMPKGIIEDVLTKIGDFIFPIDFVVLETQTVSNPKNQIPIISGRPFLATSNALINCRNGSMKLIFGNMTIKLNIFNVGKEPNELYEQPMEVNVVNKSHGLVLRIVKLSLF
ncbi:uncharacterized protein LOC135150471 [Daucus carota subsp. sativus]|uniref:uncharacterized protein LOC135150471 n=1 Tax=Daucus carota subsp. sativus TaxID=79200 RepID=UPI0030836EBF